MPDDIFECVDPNGVPFSKTNNFVDKAWAMNKIKALEAENERLREETDGGKADYCKSCGCQHENWNANYQRLTIRNDALSKENEQLREENNKMRAMHDEALLRALSVVATIRGGGDDE